MPEEEPTLADLRRDVEELKENTKELVEAWKAATKTLAFVKWVSGVAIAVAAAWAAIKAAFQAS